MHEAPTAADAPPSGDALPRRSPRARAAILAAAALLVVAFAASVFARLGTEPITRLSERRCAHVVERMVGTGDWMVPYYDGAPRLHKPPLAYWLSSLSAVTLGGPDLFTLRLPSALAGIALLLLTMAWGRSLGGGGAGLLAGVLFASMLLVGRLAREGTAEMTLALMCTLVLVLYEAARRREDRRLVPWVTLAAALAFLSKATTVLPVLALPILLDLALRRRLRAAVRPANLGWTALAVAPGVAWYVAVLVLVPSGFDRIYSEAVLPLGVIGPEPSGTHFQGPFYYLGVLFEVAPVVLLSFPILIWRLVRTRLYRDDPRMRFVALSFLVALVVFSLLAQKQKHYMMPLLPTFALLAAESWLAAWRERAAVLRWTAATTGALACAVGLAAALLYGLFETHLPLGGPVSQAAMLTLIGASAVALVAALVAAVRPRPARLAFLLLPAYFALACFDRAEFLVWCHTIEDAKNRELPYPREERLLQLASDHPDLFRRHRIGRKVLARVEEPPPR